LDATSGTILWLCGLSGAAISGDAQNGGGPIINTPSPGYVMPLYVPPGIMADPADNNQSKRFETGALPLGMQILSLPTSGSDMAETVADCTSPAG
jgi:hypothetical protein